MEEGSQREAQVDQGQSDCQLEGGELEVLLEDGQHEAHRDRFCSLADQKQSDGQYLPVLGLTLPNVVLEDLLEVGAEVGEDLGSAYILGILHLFCTLNIIWERVSQVYFKLSS